MGWGHIIKESRKQAGLTQEQLAEKVGVATITIRQYETDKRQPRYEVLQKIGEILDVDFNLDNHYSATFTRNIGERIRKARLEANLTQRELAEMTEESVETIRLYEMGDLLPPRLSLIAIAEALHITENSLLGASTGEDSETVYLDAEAWSYSLAFNISRKDYMQHYFRKLNEDGQDKVIEYASILAQVDQFRKSPRKNPKED